MSLFLLLFAVCAMGRPGFEISPVFEFDTRESVSTHFAESAVFSFDTRDSNATHVTVSGTFAFDTRLIDGNRASNISNPFPFDTRIAGLNGLAITGAAQVAPGGAIQLRAYAVYSDGQQVEVTAAADWSFLGAAPAGVTVGGGLLQAASGAAGGTATVAATYATASGQRFGSKAVTVTGGISASVTHALHALGGNSYRVDLVATPKGGAAPYSYAWDTDGDGVFGDLPGQQNPAWNLASAGGTYRVTARVTDGLGRVALATRAVGIDKPQVAGQPEKLAPAADVGAGKMRDAAGNDLGGYDEARRDVGQIVLTHGLYSTGESDKTWLFGMAAAIERELPERGKPLPAVAVYDWGYATNPADSAYASGVIGASAALAAALAQLGAYNPATLAALLAGGSAASDFLVDAGNIKGIALSHGQILATYIWLESRADPPRIRSDRPIHLIGHSAGGFVMGECAWRLKKLGFEIDLVTMLDTPAPVRGHLRPSESPAGGFPNRGTAERFISSYYGSLSPLTFLLNPDDYYYRRVFLDGWQSLLLSAHGEAHAWYRERTIEGRDPAGFYFSPFLHGRQIDRSMAMMGAFSAPRRLANGIEGGGPVSGFTPFGTVTESGGVHTLTEQADAGIFKRITVPHGVEVLRFKYRFSGVGDGDFLGVRFGAREEIYLGLDLAIARDQFLDAEVELGQYEGMTDDLVFTLVSRGGPGAVLEIKEIEIVASDDPDGDGLTVAQEIAAGSSSQSPDTDGDGWDDAHEVNVTGTHPGFADTDGDGSEDVAEVEAGTDPLDAGSRLVISSVEMAGSGVVVRWRGEAGKRYRVQRSASPGFESYDVIASGLVGTGGEMSHADAGVDTGNAREMFYRVATEE